MSQVINRFYQALAQEPQALEGLCHSDVSWHVSAPIDDLQGLGALQQDFWQPLSRALLNIERMPYIQIAGQSDGSNDHWIAATGVFVGNFVAPLFGIPATGKAAYLRFTELVQLKDDKVATGYIILDVLDLMDQAGVNPLRPSLGKTGTILPPSTFDGLNPQIVSPEHTQASMQLVKAMLSELGRFDGESLQSMQLEKYWHPDFVWYGPAGIGTTRGIPDFRLRHQGPFVFSFPDRVVDHCAMFIAEGSYAATGGWPHMHGTHTSGGWLGLPPSGQYVSLRVMDIWRREGDLLKENWVAIDIIDICRQMGLDVFAMMKAAYPN